MEIWMMRVISLIKRLFKRNSLNHVYDPCDFCYGEILTGDRVAFFDIDTKLVEFHMGCFDAYQKLNINGR